MEYIWGEFSYSIDLLKLSNALNLLKKKVISRLILITILFSLIKWKVFFIMANESTIN